MKRSLLLIAIAFLLEIIAILFFLRFQFLYYFILHAITSLILSPAITTDEEKFNNKIKLNLFLLTFLGGPLGVLLTSALLIYRLKKQEYGLFLLYEALDPPILEESIKFKGRKLGEAALKFINYYTVLYASKFLHSATIHHLKRAITVNIDEIRLFAFNKLNNLEEVLIKEIDEIKKNVDKVKNQWEKLVLYSYLAELYWEISYLGLSDKELENTYLQEAENWAFKVLQIETTPKIMYLLGRIYLKREKLDLAEAFFLKALEFKFPQVLVIPFLLEIAYKKRDWMKIHEYIKANRNIVAVNDKTRKILKVWLY